jgi:uncharacterized protein (TIGR02646 family)
MIRLELGNEPGKLEAIRTQELAKLRLIAAPTSDDVPGTYREMAEMLWERQRYKCCYCEKSIFKKFQDVEHYRPKGSADRIPGSSEKHGYWWLAYTWNNLLFACNNCNRTSKNDYFPLKTGSTALLPEEFGPLGEIPLLIHPGETNPVEHIIFELKPKFVNGRRYWMAEPRGSSELGIYTIRICDLNRDELLESRGNYAENFVFPQIESIRREISEGDLNRTSIAFSRALEMCLPRFEFAALSYDIFRAELSNNAFLIANDLEFPEPSLACR